MAKSKIIKDLANSEINVMTALKRAKLLFSELENEELLNWTNYEIEGYPENAPLPEYRIKVGTLIGSYFKGSLANHMKWNNVSLPLGKMPDDLVKDLLTIEFRDGVEALKRLEEEYTKNGGQLGKVVQAAWFPLIAKYNNDMYMNITSAQVVISINDIQNVFSVIENKLLDALLVLEKEFGNLDELDLDVTSKDSTELQKIVDKIIVIIYNDRSINIGDDNKFKDTTITT